MFLRVSWATLMAMVLIAPSLAIGPNAVSAGAPDRVGMPSMQALPTPIDLPIIGADAF